jgi:hypothetical protein
MKEVPTSGTRFVPSHYTPVSLCLVEIWKFEYRLLSFLFKWDPSFCQYNLKMSGRMKTTECTVTTSRVKKKSVPMLGKQLLCPTSGTDFDSEFAWLVVCDDTICIPSLMETRGLWGLHVVWVFSLQMSPLSPFEQSDQCSWSLLWNLCHWGHTKL